MNLKLRCSYCGHDNPGEAGFCGNCGARLSAVATRSAGLEVALADTSTPGTAATPSSNIEQHLENVEEAATKVADTLEDVQEELATVEGPAQQASANGSGFRCPQCGIESPLAARFCGGCGSSLSAAEASSLPRADAVGSKAATIALKERVEYAGFWRRAVAWLLDSIILWLGAGVVSAVLGPFPYDSDVVLWVALLSPYLVPVLYGVLFVGLRGQTPGKMLLHICVVNEDRQVPGFWRAALRETAGKWVSALALGLGFLSVARNSEKRGWHDHIAGTYVIKV